MKWKTFSSFIFLTALGSMIMFLIMGIIVTGSLNPNLDYLVIGVATMGFVFGIGSYAILLAFIKHIDKRFLELDESGIAE